MKPPFKADYDENADVLYIIGLTIAQQKPTKSTGCFSVTRRTTANWSGLLYSIHP